MTISLGLLARSPLYPSLRDAGLGITLRLPTPERIVEHAIGGVTRRVAQPVTLTPFASAQGCSARCVFCSETLVHRDARTLAASLRPAGDYHAGLRRALRELRGLPIGISLSGLEATDDAGWLLGVLDALGDHERESPVEERVLYTNAAGLARETTGATLLPRLRDYGLTRAEVSRQHFDQGANDAIMRFRPGRPIRDRAVFERTLIDVQDHVPVRLVCILQAGGVATAEGVAAYVAWAAKLGVGDVVFRELSRLGEEYADNRPLRTIEANRVALEPLVEALWPTLVPHAVTAGYYFWNVRTTLAGVTVTFETSDYREMKRRHTSGVVFKLIYHANGNLCGDWDPDREVLFSTR
jgi:hypothetical protein